MLDRKQNYWVVFGLFAVAFLTVPLKKMGWLSLIPGDLGDARLNNYFLENIYQFLVGNSPSLVNLSFFYPFPYVLGFSDNLFGASPFYLIARALSAQSDTAFQIWYLAGYFVNFIAAHYALRKLGFSSIAAAVGSLIFAFALPVTAHAGHAQLHYRFGVPLAIVAFIRFLDGKNWRDAVIAFGWLVWQFYCTIYIGFFLLAFLVTMASIYCVGLLAEGNGKAKAREFFKQWTKLPARSKVRLVSAFFALTVLMGVLFYPYLQVSVVYGAKRTLVEIASMLPRPQSYFLSDGSWLWASRSEIFAGLPMRHEHQMFFGAAPILLGVIGVLVGSRGKNGLAFPLLCGSLAVLILATLHVGGFSVWYVFARLPLASAIRAMTRIDLVFLFPVAFLSAVAVDKIRERGWGGGLLYLVLIPVLIIEFSTASLAASSKLEWRNRIAQAESAIPENVPDKPVLFFAQSKGPFFADELDAMWVALSRGVSTLNGYSGLFPPGYSPEYGNDCAELPKRIHSYLDFSGGAKDMERYRSIARRIVPIGFSGCDQGWLNDPPPITRSNEEYTPDEFKALSIHYGGAQRILGRWFVRLRIDNSGSRSIAAGSALGKPVRVSWRFVGSDGKPLTGWDARKDLMFDVPGNGSSVVTIPIDPGADMRWNSLEFSIVQEGVFWGHDVGVVPLSIVLNSD